MKKEPSKRWLEFRQTAPAKAKKGLCRAGRWLRASFALKPKEALAVLKNGLIFHNPVLVLLLGLCSTLAVTATLKSSLFTGLAAAAVLVLANLILALLRRHLPPRVRAVTSVVVTAAPDCDHTPGYAVVEGLALGLGFTLALCLLGTVRELLGAGTLWGASLLGDAFQPVLLLATPWGGLILLGLFLALAQWLRNHSGERGGQKA